MIWTILKNLISMEKPISNKARSPTGDLHEKLDLHLFEIANIATVRIVVIRLVTNGINRQISTAHIHWELTSIPFLT